MTLPRPSRRSLLIALATPALEGLLRPLAAGTVAATPERRIISAGGAITEVLYALGREAEIVGVDSTSQHPAEALQTKANVGYLRALGAEGVLSLKPNLVIATDGAGPPDVLRISRAPASRSCASPTSRRRTASCAASPSSRRRSRRTRRRSPAPSRPASNAWRRTAIG